ncbi:MAG: HPr family phosphocarrier protein [Negativicutes bacterium]|nr:HPr family phosphocarrier protein [Negativicutes bacterium]
MVEREIFITNKTGLHARPAAQFIKEACKYKSSISVFKNGKKADAKSIIGILGLGIAQGAEITVQASGEDEDQAIMELEKLIFRLAQEEK